MQVQADLISQLLITLKGATQPGVNLLEIEKLAADFLKEHGAKSANKGYPNPFDPKKYKKYPAVICASVNDEIAHTPPADYYLKEGDLVTYDVGLEYKGMFGDAGLTVAVGESSNRDLRLLRYAKRALYMGIDQIKPGVKVTEIGRAVEQYSRLMGYVVNTVFIGHSIGKQMHGDIKIPMFDVTSRVEDWSKVPVLKVGDVVCLEPFLTYKDPIGVMQKDGWNFKTADGSKSAMFEHMVEVTEDGYKILTTHIKAEEAF